jgi:hypothetical protein
LLSLQWRADAINKFLLHRLAGFLYV